MMTNGWRIARFDEILTRVDRKFIIDDDQEYETVGVRWYGNGAFVRERLLGANINRKQQWIIKAGDVVYNKLFAWKNAFAIADELVDGRIVSDKFPTYQIKTDLLEPKFLECYFKTPQIGTQARNLSKGAAAISKLTLNPPQFWDLTIPLPPLTEQRRIVAHIESLAARVNEAQRLREEADNETEAFVKSERHKLFSVIDLGKCGKPLGEIADFLDGKRIPLNASQRKEKQPGNIPYYGASGIVDYINEWIFDDTLLLEPISKARTCANR
jgi:type I restriction enzyme S subunit